MAGRASSPYILPCNWYDHTVVHHLPFHWHMVDMVFRGLFACYRSPNYPEFAQKPRPKVRYHQVNHQPHEDGTIQTSPSRDQSTIMPEPPTPRGFRMFSLRLRRRDHVFDSTTARYPSSFNQLKDSTLFPHPSDHTGGASHPSCSPGCSFISIPRPWTFGDNRFPKMVSNAAKYSSHW